MTRATDVLRFPVPWYCACSAIAVPQWKRLRRLGLVRMVRPCVDLELEQLRAAEAVPREHALDRLAEHFGRPALELVAQRPAAEPARIAGVPVVHLVVELLAGDRDLLRVHDDDEIAGVDVGRVLRLALAAQRVGDVRREPAQGLPLGIDDVPVALDLAGLCVPGLLHDKKVADLSPPGRNGTSHYAAGSGAGRILARKIAGATAIAVAPIASAVTPSTSSATPPRSASAAPVRPESRSLSPSSLPRSAGAVASASCAVAETNDRFQPIPSPKRRNAVVGTLVAHTRPAQETAITNRPPSSAGPRPILSISVPMTSTSAYMPRTCAPMIRKTDCCEWW